MEKTIDLEYLKIERDVNLAAINKNRFIISYYCSLYSNILSSINLKKERIKTYEMILSLKNVLNSPRMLEKISFISDKHVEKILDEITDEIEALTKDSMVLRQTINDYQRRSLDLETRNKAIGEIFDGSYEQTLKPKVKERGKNETRRRV